MNQLMLKYVDNKNKYLEWSISYKFYKKINNCKSRLKNFTQ
jgi:hypothetical protein